LAELLIKNSSIANFGRRQQKCDTRTQPTPQKQMWTLTTHGEKALTTMEMIFA